MSRFDKRVEAGMNIPEFRTGYQEANDEILAMVRAERDALAAKVAEVRRLVGLPGTTVMHTATYDLANDIRAILDAAPGGKVGK